MGIELIAIDLDGTLLDSRHGITERTCSAITAARNKGVHVALASGRPFAGMRDYLELLDLRQAGHYCITNNGALVQRADTAERLTQSTLGFDDYLHFEAMARELGVHYHVHVLDEDAVYTANHDISPHTVREVYLTHMPLKYRSVVQMDREMRFLKLMMIDDEAVLDAAMSRVPDAERQRYSIFKSSPYFLEFLNLDANKGHGLQWLTRHLGIAAENVMALGDQQNDLAMLEFAGLGIAMGNAIDAVKAAGEHVTGTNDEDGVAQAIERFVLDA